MRKSAKNFYDKFIKLIESQENLFKLLKPEIDFKFKLSVIFFIINIIITVLIVWLMIQILTS
ncbi:MAG: hypothetical protein ABIL89_02595 [candidate division WOR-3 bacterium]